MSITSIFSGVGSLAGLGIGIYAATQNFDPEAHQAASMTESTRIFTEILLQIGSTGLYSVGFGVIAGVIGLIGDAVTCCKFVDNETKGSVKSYTNYGSCI